MDHRKDRVPKDRGRKKRRGKSNIAVHACNPGSQKADRELKIGGQAGLHSESEATLCYIAKHFFKRRREEREIKLNKSRLKVSKHFKR